MTLPAPRVGLAAGVPGRQNRRVPLPPPDADNAAWLRDLASPAGREAAAARLHGYLLRIARMEAGRRRASLPARGAEEVDDLCIQAANDALLGVLAKLGEFRGEARFTTWAAKFAIFEVSTRLRRHAWRQRQVHPDERVWDTLADHAPPALQALEGTETLALLARVVREELTERQRRVFQAAVLDEVPIDVLAGEAGTSRGAIYKVLHDARAKLRRALRRHEGEEAP